MPLTNSDLHPLKREKESEQGRHSPVPRPWSDQVLDGIERTDADGGRSLAARVGRGGKGRGPLGDPPQMQEPNLQPWFSSHLGSGSAAFPSAHRVQAAGGDPRWRLGGVRPIVPPLKEEQREREGQHSVAPPMTASGTSMAPTVEARSLKEIGEGRKRATEQPSSVAGADWLPYQFGLGGMPVASLGLDCKWRSPMVPGWHLMGFGRSCHRPRGDGDRQERRRSRGRRRKEEGVAIDGSRH